MPPSEIIPSSASLPMQQQSLGLERQEPTLMELIGAIARDPIAGEENTMQATITYLLSEQAQRAQIAATGQPVARKQSVAVEVSTELFLRGTKAQVLAIDASGTVTADLTHKLTMWDIEIPGEIDVSGLSADPLDYLDDRIIDVERAIAKHEDDVAGGENAPF